MALTDSAIRGAKSKDKPYKLNDDGGLFLLVAASGSKLWRLKYRFSGQEKLLALGQYPTVGLNDAPARRDEAKRLLSENTDPSMDKKAQSGRCRRPGEQHVQSGRAGILGKA